MNASRLHLKLSCNHPGHLHHLKSHKSKNSHTIHTSLHINTAHSSLLTVALFSSLPLLCLPHRTFFLAQLAPPCVALHEEMGGVDVEATTYSGTTEQEQDQSCCDKCTEHPDCEFWVRNTEGHNCWLKKDFNGAFSARSNRRGSFKSDTPTAPGECLHRSIILEQPKQ